jgi:DNA modification methylase
VAKPPVLETTTLWDFPTQNYGNIPHGDNKFNGVTPAFIIWNLIQRYTKKDDLVVDPMCGSGTTCKAARQLGRDYIGIDITYIPH